MEQRPRMAGCTGNAAVMKCAGEIVQISDHAVLVDVC